MSIVYNYRGGFPLTSSLAGGKGDPLTGLYPGGEGADRGGLPYTQTDGQEWGNQRTYPAAP